MRPKSLGWPDIHGFDGDLRNNEKEHEEHKIQKHNTPGKNRFALNSPNHRSNRMTRKRPLGRIPWERSTKKWHSWWESSNSVESLPWERLSTTKSQRGETKSLKRNLIQLNKWMIFTPRAFMPPFSPSCLSMYPDHWHKTEYKVVYYLRG
jgi:hypothetical protein